MTSITLHPSLDTDGWINTPVKVADAMISHFFLSDYSQTSEFPNEVASFIWILQQYQSDQTRLREEVQSTLSTYFSKQFSNVEVQVSDVPNPDSINRQQIALYLVFTDQDGVEHNLSRLARYTDLKVTEILSVIAAG